MKKYCFIKKKNLGSPSKKKKLKKKIEKMKKKLTP